MQSGKVKDLQVAANTALGSVFGHAMIEGQLYFAAWPHLMAAVILGLMTAAGAYWLMPIVVRFRLFPSHACTAASSNGTHLAFDLLVVVGMAVATATVGLMAASAVAFIPPWLSLRLARNWK